MLAAAKAGFKVYDLDSSVTDIHDIRQFLKISNAKAIYFYPKTGDPTIGDLRHPGAPKLKETHPEVERINYMKLLRQSIPEFFYCKFCLHDLL
jgi:hypothetical protein